MSLFIILVFIVTVFSMTRVDYKLNWYDAEKYCNNAFGTHLVSIHNNDDHTNAFSLCVKFL